MSTIKELKKYLKNNYKDTDHIAYSMCSKEDILIRAEEREILITDEEANNIIEMMHYHLYEITGISWDFVDMFLDEIIRDKE